MLEIQPEVIVGYGFHSSNLAVQEGFRSDLEPASLGLEFNQVVIAFVVAGESSTLQTDSGRDTEVRKTSDPIVRS